MGAFRQGDAFLASVEGGVLKVEVQKERSRIPLHWRGLLTVWSQDRAEYARVNLDRLASVSYDANDRFRWFDLADQRGYSLRLLFQIGELTHKESAVLTALRDHVGKCHLQVDPETRRALGISNYLP